MKTIFVLGAGANVEIGMPDGHNLIKKISELFSNVHEEGGQLSGDNLIINYITYAYTFLNHNKNRTIQNLHLISDGLKNTDSIDNYISSHDYQHKDIQFYCKLALVSVLLNAERECKLLDSTGNLALDNMNDTSYEPLFRFLINNNNPEKAKERLESIKIINFNYDRCFEFYFYYKLKSLFYGISENQILNLFLSLEIIHPYGKLGILPFIDRVDGIDFGGLPSNGKMMELTENIKTYSEGLADKQSNTIQINKALNDANRIIFLGFAFHKQNMDLIFSKNSKFLPDECTCYGTVFGTSEEDKILISNNLKKVLNIKELTLKPCVCKEFMNNYYRTLLDEELS
jgi:hypothetical protein